MTPRARSSSVAARLVLGGAAALLALGSAGCDRGGEERHLDEMTREIEHLQVQQDEQIREALGTDVADTHFSQVPPRTPASARLPPPAMVLGADGQPLEGEAELGDTEDPTPRPTIHVVGGGRGARGGDTGSSLVDDTMTGAGAAPPPRASALDPEAKRAYDAAMHEVSARRYDRALDDLAAFLVKWPDHPYADNAMYWRGECYFARGDYLHAAEQFEGAVTRFPAGNKAPDALLKLGMSQQKLGNPVQAREYFDRLAHNYPQSEAARRIPTVTVQAVTPSGAGSEDHR